MLCVYVIKFCAAVGKSEPLGHATAWRTFIGLSIEPNKPDKRTQCVIPFL